MNLVGGTHSQYYKTQKPMTKCYLTVSVEAERFLTSLTEGISICLSRALSVLASWIPTFTVISLYTNLELAKT